MHSQPMTFWQWFTSLDSGDLAGLVFLAVVAVLLIIIALSVFVYSMHRNRLQHELKRELLDRGFSAEEIALIVYGKTRGELDEPRRTGSRRNVQVKQ